MNTYIAKDFIYLLLGCSNTIFGQTHPMLITVFFKFLLKGHRQFCNKVGSLRPVMHLARFKPRNFRLYHNALALSLHTNTALNGYMDKLQIISVTMVRTNRS